MCSSVFSRLTWLLTDHPPGPSLAALAMSNNTSSNAGQNAPTQSNSPMTTTTDPNPTNTSNPDVNKPTTTLNPDANKPHETAPPPASPPAPSPTTHPPENTSKQSPPHTPTNQNSPPKESSPNKPPPQPQPPTQEDHSNPSPKSPNTEPSNPAPPPDTSGSNSAPASPDTPKQPLNSPDVPVTLITITMTPDSPGETAIVTVVKTSTQAVTNDSGVTTRLISMTVSETRSPKSTAGLQNDSAGVTDSNGLSGGGKIAMAVVVPIAAVTVFILAALFIFRKRKQRKHAEELRRKEVEEYGYNPNQDPTFPDLSPSPPTQEPQVTRKENAGYRGWGNTVSPPGRKKSNTVSSTAPTVNIPAGMAGIGIAYSDGEPANYGNLSETKSDNPLIPEIPMSENRPEILGTKAISNQNNSSVNRASNSSSGSGENRSDGSREVAGSPFNNNSTAFQNNQNNSSSSESTSGRAEMAAHPIIRDVQARRNTRIENPSHIPRLHNTGIAKNF